MADEAAARHGGYCHASPVSGGNTYDLTLRIAEAGEEKVQ